MREQDKINFDLSALAGAVERAREMLARLAQPQRGAVAVNLLPSIAALESAVTRLVSDICRYVEEEAKGKN